MCAYPAPINKRVCPAEESRMSSRQFPFIFSAERQLISTDRHCFIIFLLYHHSDALLHEEVCFLPTNILHVSAISQGA